MEMGKCGNAEMENGGKSVAAGGLSAVIHKQWQWQSASVLANPSRAQLELTGNHFRSRF